MSTIRPAAVHAAYAHTPPAHSNSDAENGAIEGWDDDIVRASRASVRKRGLKPDDPFADDVAQNLRLAVMLAIRKTGINDERYLRRVISNSAKNSARQTQVASLEVSDDTLALLPLEPTARDVLAERRVRQWIGYQPSQFQALFDLLYREDLSQRDAAMRLGVSQPRVAQLHRQLLERGKGELRDLAA